ncbi:ribonucleases P/MRP protein subunit POP1 [Linepithema humile]|uniref:ribonucleases P/MRP protein subunit POP1 n=1 Tax=Linepithema humile TaxID=83485 RepID=UPI00351EBC01
MAKRKQFDEFLGGSQSLPHEVSIAQFASSRAQEISMMTYSIENPKQTKLVFQKLPVYMRRRVMSHNVKRLPRRLREAHLAQMTKSANGKNLPLISKRPSRKYRRRPRNLLSEYSRRQRNKIWLETHIWHAKRFHMIDKWGYRIANYPNDKCFRANYRAVTKHCLLQDISYYTCIEIKGEENLLKTTLKTHCNPTTLTFAAKKWINGNREGAVMFFKKNGYPHFPIGNVNFFWRPKESDVRTIWIWVHPAFYNDFFDEIISSFEFKQKNVEKSATDTHNLNCLYTNDLNCEMIILRNALNRFRLYGPLALKVLTEALHLPSLTELEHNLSSEKELDTSKESTDSNILQPTEKMTIDETSENNTVILKDLNIQELSKKVWHIKYYKSQENMEAFKIQNQLWQTMKSREPNFLPTSMIIGLTVLDPRFYLPEKRTKCKMEETSSRLKPIDQSPINSNRTPFWDAEIRHTVSNSCVSTSAINKLRGECLVPGILNDQYYNENIMAKIPILLIQKEGTITGLGSGMDIIIPARWSMPFWIAFVMRCVRVGALRESRSVAFESLILNVLDINDPDSPAYAREALCTKEELTNKYFRYPPNRRVNFIKVGISSPFFCDWKNLTKDWSDVENFYVLRSREHLLLLQAGITSPVKKRYARLPAQVTKSDFQELDKYKNCLVHVKVSMVGKGSPKEFAIVCMPTREDLEKFESNKKWSGPVEKRHADPNERSRKILRKSHLMLLKRLRRHRIRLKKTLGDNVLTLLEGPSGKLDEDKHLDILSRRKIISNQLEKMSKLYLPECTDVRYSCDREVMGYLTMGHLSFSEAKGIGIGYVTLASLLKMMDKRSDIALVRNTKTRQYRLAKLSILGL